MSGYTNFVAMTRSEAASYLRRFLDEMEPAMIKFAGTIECELHYSPSALERVWSRVIPHLAWRSEPVSEQLEPASELPSWFHHPSGAGYARFSAETLWLIDGAGRYLGETLVRNIGGRWASGDSPVEGYMFQNQPVIAGVVAEPVSPIQACAVIAARSLRSDVEQGPRSLADLYGTWRAETP